MSKPVGCKVVDCGEPTVNESDWCDWHRPGGGLVRKLETLPDLSKQKGPKARL